MQADEYNLSIAGGSRVDEFCLSCKLFQFTQNTACVRCGMNIPRYLETSVTEVTLRPTGSGKGMSSTCAQFRPIYDSETQRTRIWLHNLFIDRLKKQIMAHEKIAQPLEMYMIASYGSSTADGGVSAEQIPISRDSLFRGRATVLIDNANKKVWVHAGREMPKGLLTGMLKILGGMAGSMEDSSSTIFLRDLLKRDIESFQIETLWTNQETPEFYATIDRGASQNFEIKQTKKEEPQTFQGPKTEMYQINYHLGRGYTEFYSGGRSDSETKAITLEPLKMSLEGLDKKHLIAVVDHQARTVWHWVGDKTSWSEKFSSKHIPTNNKFITMMLGIIGNRIGRNLDGYDYVVIYQNKEPEKFKRLFQ